MHNVQSLKNIKFYWKKSYTCVRVKTVIKDGWRKIIFLHHPLIHKIVEFIDKNMFFFTHKRRFLSISYRNSIQWLLCCTFFILRMAYMSVHATTWIDWYYLIIQFTFIYAITVTCIYLYDVHLSILCVFLMEIDIHFFCIYTQQYKMNYFCLIFYSCNKMI